MAETESDEPLSEPEVDADSVSEEGADGAKKRLSKSMMIKIAAGVIVVIALAAGGYFFFASSDETSDSVEIEEVSDESSEPDQKDNEGDDEQTSSLSDGESDLDDLIDDVIEQETQELNDGAELQLGSEPEQALAVELDKTADEEVMEQEDSQQADDLSAIENGAMASELAKIKQQALELKQENERLKKEAIELGRKQSALQQNNDALNGGNYAIDYYQDYPGAENVKRDPPLEPKWGEFDRINK